MMLLWIRRIFSTRSAVYIGANRLDKDCIQLARMLEKKRLVCKRDVSAHPILCISSGLSTAGLPAQHFLPVKRLLSELPARRIPRAGKARLDRALFSAREGRHQVQVSA